MLEVSALASACCLAIRACALPMHKAPTAQRHRLGGPFSSHLLLLFRSIKTPPNVVSNDRMAKARTLSALGTDFPTTSASDPCCICRSQRHEHPENDNADCCHQNDVAVSFHYQCLLEALMAMLAIPMIVPAMT